MWVGSTRAPPDPRDEGGDVLRTLLRTTATLALLVGGYLGYCRGFAVVAARVGGSQSVPIIPFDPSPARTQRETFELARAAFGPNHWTADPMQATSYYDSERRYWMFFKSYEPKLDGRRLEFAPFAIIWQSGGKANLNTLRGDVAYIDFDKPFTLVSKPGTEPARIVHAQIDGEVHLRDDKGTRENPGDDLTIGPMTHVEYSESTQQITTDSYIELREGDLVATGVGLIIQLRPSEPTPGKPASVAGGFKGAQSVELRSRIHIAVEDVGRTGIVPGGKVNGERRPGELKCDGPARFEFPPPRPKGAPADAPREPIIAHFFKNVVAHQGDPRKPDQLTADVLRLTFHPTEKAPPGATAKAGAGEPDPAGGDASGGGSPLSGLTLTAAEANGHAVWLQSPADGLEAFGNQLIYTRNAPAKPDVIFFRGDSETKVDKINLVASGPDAGKVESVDTILTKDITIHRGLKPGEPPAVIARGPGRFESRPDRTQPVQMTATWADRLVMQQVTTAAGERRRVELIGSPTVHSPTQGDLEAQDRIRAYLKPRPSTTQPSTTQPGAAALAAGAPADGAAAPARASLQIDWVEALGQVHMTAVPDAQAAGGPGGQRELFARKRLDAVFAIAEPTADAPSAPAALPAATSDPAPASQPGAPAEELAKAPPKPAEPAMRVEADNVWARVTLASLRGKPELEEVRLRRGVTIHQDPPEGKTRGTDIAGDAVDLVSLGAGLARMEVHGTAKAPASVTSEDMLIEGLKIGLDQASDYAWADGAGRLFQDAPEKADQPPQEKVANTTDPKPDETRQIAKGPVEIRWTRSMEFFGKPDPADSPDGNAYALFLGQVNARSTDSTVHCGEMKAFLDAPFSFQRGRKDPAAPAESQPRPKIAVVRCRKDVDLVHYKTDPATKALQQKGRLIGPHVDYSLVTGEFLVQGQGTAWLYKPKAPESKPTDETSRAGTPTPAPSGLRPTVARRPQESAKASRPTILELTRISFQKRVSGSFGNGGDGVPAPKSPFLANFAGGVQVINSPVANAETDIDPDNDLPPGAMVLASEALRVVRELPAGRSARKGEEDDTDQEQFFIDATGHPTALSPPRSIRGDRITYDSVKDLVYVYGDEHEVQIVNQDSPGQPFSATRGRGVMFNRKTNDFKLIDPKNALVIDPRSGIRERPVPPGTADRKPKDPRKPLRRVPASDKERRGFKGT
jgi:hypothetical protein